MARPVLSPERRKLRVQVYLEPHIAKLANLAATEFDMPLSAVVSLMAQRGAKAAVQALIEDKQQRVETTSTTADFKSSRQPVA